MTRPTTHALKALLCKGQMNKALVYMLAITGASEVRMNCIMGIYSTGEWDCSIMRSVRLQRVYYVGATHIDHALYTMKHANAWSTWVKTEMEKM